MNLLVVDDSSTMRSILQKIIQMSRLPVEHFFEAANGQEGLDQLSRQKVDLVLLDLNMPIMGGLEMIERVRAKPEFAQLPIVVTSTESSQTRISEIKSKGIHFIHKPFTPTRVREVIQLAMGGSQV
jgi:two-component system, chemotaxis family, chemotaxis protein CheY